MAKDVKKKATASDWLARKLFGEGANRQDADALMKNIQKQGKPAEQTQPQPEPEKVKNVQPVPKAELKKNADEFIEAVKKDQDNRRYLNYLAEEKRKYGKK
jgi:predicted RNA-binding protein with PIN domain